MQGAGSALMGIGSARGDDRAVQAAELAISSPLLEASIDGAHGVLLSIQVARTSVSSRSTRPPASSRRPRTPRPTSSSAPSSTTPSATRCASRSSRRASTAAVRPSATTARSGPSRARRHRAPPRRAPRGPPASPRRPRRAPRPRRPPRSRSRRSQPEPHPAQPVPAVAPASPAQPVQSPPRTVTLRGRRRPRRPRLPQVGPPCPRCTHPCRCAASGWWPRGPTAPARVPLGVHRPAAVGSSAAPYDALNLGGAVGDDPAAVAANRSAVAATYDVAPARLLFMAQCHGTRVVQVDGPGRASRPPATRSSRPATTWPSRPWLPTAPRCCSSTRSPGWPAPSTPDARG